MNVASLLLKNPSFAKMWVGQILSQSCGRMFQMASVWWILTHVTAHSGRWVGLFMVSAALPSLLFVKPMGRMIDSVSRKKILVCADFIQALFLIVAASLYFMASMRIEVILVLGFLAATLQALIDPTLNKAVVEVIEVTEVSGVSNEETVEGAVGLLASTQALASFSGAILGASLIAHLGIAGTVLLAASGYFASSVFSALATFKIQTNAKRNDTEANWALLESYPLLKKVLIGFAWINFFATPVLVVLPLYVKGVLKRGPQALGILEASVWLGLVVGSWSAPAIPAGRSPLKMTSLLVLVFGLGLGIPAVTTQIEIYGIALFLAGLALGINNAKFMIYFQTTVAPEVKGRFFALMQALLGSTFPIAYFLFGSLTDIISIQTVCLIQSLGVVVLSSYFYFLALSFEPPAEAIA